MSKHELEVRYDRRWHRYGALEDKVSAVAGGSKVGAGLSMGTGHRYLYFGYSTHRGLTAALTRLRRSFRGYRLCAKQSACPAHLRMESGAVQTPSPPSRCWQHPRRVAVVCGRNSRVGYCSECWPGAIVRVDPRGLIWSARAVTRKRSS